MPYSIIFAGTPAFALPSLEALLKDPAFTVTHVITQPDKPAGRKQELTASPVKTLAEHKKIPVLQPKNLNKEWKSLQLPVFDFLVVVAYGQILSQEILDAPGIAPVNVHGSLLPRWRGASPMQHAILAGDRGTGVTIQRMVKALDAGPILAQEKIPMDPRETFETLHDRLSVLGAELLLKTLKAPLLPREQDPSGITVCSKLKREDGVVDPSRMTAEEVDRTVRALVPWPGVRMTLEAQEVKIYGTELSPAANAIEIPCAKNSILYVTKLQSPGKKILSAAEWLRGK